MINKDCIYFKRQRSGIVYFPTCDLKENKRQPYKKIITDYNCENCRDYKKKEEK